MPMIPWASFPHMKKCCWLVIPTAVDMVAARPPMLKARSVISSPVRLPDPYWRLTDTPVRLPPYSGDTLQLEQEVVTMAKLLLPESTIKLYWSVWGGGGGTKR